jgi:hypothetical protein
MRNLSPDARLSCATPVLETTAQNNKRENSFTRVCIFKTSPNNSFVTSAHKDTRPLLQLLRTIRRHHEQTKQKENNKKTHLAD